MCCDMKMKNLVMTFGWEQFNQPPTAQTDQQVTFICSCILNPSLLAGGSTKTMRWKKPLPRALHSRRHHSTMKGYKNWCSAMITASTMVETVLKSSVQYVHQMAIYRVCNIFLFFLNSPAELTFWITYICNTSFTLSWICLWCLIFLQYQMSFINFTWIALVL